MTLLETSPLAIESPVSPAPRCECSRFLAGWSAAAFLLLAAEMAVSHLALTQSLGWKLLPVAYCLWAAGLATIVALRRDLSRSAAWTAAAVFAHGAILAILGAILHAQGEMLIHLIGQGQVPASTRWVPLVLAVASAAAALSCLPGLGDAVRRRCAAALAAIATTPTTTIAAFDHAAAPVNQSWLTLGVGLVLPACACAVALLFATRARNARLRQAITIAGLLQTLAGIGGAIAHIVAGTSLEAPAAWLVPQRIPVGGPLMLAGMGLVYLWSGRRGRFPPKTSGTP